MPLPDILPSRVPAYEGREDIFGYEPSVDGRIEWYLNFADPRLFAAYEGPLLAQDELQVLEHPSLASVHEALRRNTRPEAKLLTIEDGSPTPILVRGVERRCALALDRNAAQGRPDGLYGNRFSRATPDAVQRALRVLHPPTVSNLLAISALPGGRGPYTADQIRWTLVTALSGFSAALLESRELAPESEVVVHTGHWGTGAFGGNRTLMAMLQILAARFACIDRLIFHTVDADGAESWEDALRWGAERVWTSGTERVEDLVARLVAMEFAWGISDGN